MLKDEEPNMSFAGNSHYQCYYYCFPPIRWHKRSASLSWVKQIQKNLSEKVTCFLLSIRRILQCCRACSIYPRR